MVQVSSPAPPTPLSIEQDFRALLQRLSYPWSSRKQLAEVESFLRRVRVDCNLYESYILETAQRIPDIVARLNILGIDPATLRPLYEELKEMIIALPSLSGVKGLGDAMQKLRLALSTLYQFVGEIHHGNEFQVVESSSPDVDRTTVRTESILVPVVERSLVDIPGMLKEYGYLRRISIEITGPSKSEADAFYTQALILGHDGGLTNTLVSPVLAARSYLSRAVPHLHHKHFSGFVTFDELNAFHQGSSANFAIATLLYCILLKYVGARDQFRLNKNVTMTGDISEGGEILPVDADSLKLKTEAVFFSDIQFFVVPKGQLSIAEEVLKSLCLRYPHRQLSVIGLSRLQEVFYDRRLSSEVRAGAIGHALRKTWRYKFPVAGLATIAVLLLIIARYALPPSNDNPVSAEFVGERMLIENDAGETLEEIKVGSPILQYAVGRNGKMDASKVCKFYDVNGDGKNEFIYVTNNGGDAGDVNSLICRSLWRKLARWQVSFRVQATFPQNPVDTQQLLLLNDFIVGNFEARAVPEVFAIAHHVFFPCEVYKINAQNGTILGSYLHTGHLGAIAAADMDGNSLEEIVVAGWNNAYNCSSLCILDPRFVSGHSPSQGNYTPQGSSPGTEMYYVLIPPTVPVEAFPRMPTSGGPFAISVDRSNKFISLGIADLNATAPDSKETLSGTLVLTFNSAMQVLNVNTTTTWDRAARILLKEGQLRTVPNAAYLNTEYKKKLLYWDGEGWRHTPVMNKRYLEALKQFEEK